MVRYWFVFDDRNLIPASAKFTNVSNVVESHLLERNKIRNKFPTLESKIGDPEAAITGVNSLTYNWKFGHAPTPPNSTNQDDNCLWWNQKADRGDDYLTTGDSAVDTNRQLIHSATVQAFDRDRNKPVKLNIDRVAIRSDLNKRQVIFAQTPPLTGKNLSFNTTTFSRTEDCNDIESSDPNFTFKPQFTAVGSTFPGKLVSPVVFYSASVGENNTDPTGYHKTSQHHRDYYVDTKDVPMQGPFTEQHVGGYQYRHVGFNANASTTRPEGWYSSVSGSTSGSTYYTIYNPSAVSTAYPRADRSRGHIAKVR